MTDTQHQIGTILTVPAERDAIHIAVAPVVACERIRPGQAVGLDENGCARVSRIVPIGIADPFLTVDWIESGQRFYLWLTPNTITGLRHHWQHPAFAEVGRSAAIEQLADCLGISYAK